MGVVSDGMNIGGGNRVVDKDNTGTSAHPHSHTPILPYIFLAVLAFATRFFRLGYQSFWFDEVFSLRVTEKPLGQLILNALRDAVHPPLYYLVLFPFLRVTPTEWAARLPSALLGVGFVLLMFITTDALLGRRVAWVAAAATLLSAYQVYFAQETRMYALLSFLTLFSTLLLYRSVAIDKASIWLGYIIVTFLALMTHYMAIGLVVAHGLWMLFCKRRQLTRWLLSQAVVLSLCLPWIIGMLILGHSIENRAAGGSPQTALWGLLGSFLDFNFSYFEGLFREPLAVLVLTMIGVLVGGCFWWVGVRSLKDEATRAEVAPDRTCLRVDALILLTYFCPLVFSFIVAARSEFHLPRYFAVAYPAGIMILATGLVTAWESRREFAVTGGLVFVILNGISLKNYYFNPVYFREDWRGVSRFMTREKQQQDILVFNASWEDIPFRQYYKEDFLKGGLPREPGDSASRVAEEASRVITGHRRVWLILCYDYISDPEHHVRDWFQKHLNRVGEWRFSQITVLLYENARVKAE